MGVWEVAVVEEYLEGVSGFLVAGVVQRTVSDHKSLAPRGCLLLRLLHVKTWTG